MNRLEAFRSIAAQTTEGELTFPTHMSVLLKIKKELESPHANIVDTAKLISTEPLMASKVVALANSAAYNRTGYSVASVSAAAVRLGSGCMKSLTFAHLASQMGAKMPNALLRAMSEQLWQHSVHVAALSRVIAKKMTHVDADTALFAGITHELGGFYLLSQANRYPGLVEGPLEDWEEYGEKIIGRGVLSALETPKVIKDAVEKVWSGQGVRPPETLGDILCLANRLAPIASPLRPAKQEDERYDSIDFDLHGTSLRAILKEAAEEVESIVDALNAK